MPTRKRTRRQKRGGSALRIPSSVVKTVRKYFKNKQNKPNNPTLPRAKAPNHSNLTNANLENLHVVNINTEEWKVKPGNFNRYVPRNLRPYSHLTRLPPSPTHAALPASVQPQGPGVRVFQTR